MFIAYEPIVPYNRLKKIEISEPNVVFIWLSNFKMFCMSIASRQMFSVLDSINKRPFDDTKI